MGWRGQGVGRWGCTPASASAPGELGKRRGPDHLSLSHTFSAFHESFLPLRARVGVGACLRVLRRWYSRRGRAQGANVISACLLNWSNWERDRQQHTNCTPRTHTLTLTHTHKHSHVRTLAQAMLYVARPHLPALHPRFPPLNMFGGLGGGALFSPPPPPSPPAPTPTPSGKHSRQKP